MLKWYPGGIHQPFLQQVWLQALARVDHNIAKLDRRCALAGNAATCVLHESDAAAD
jgi:hypothetical protein